MVVTKTRVNLKELPITAEEIQNAFFELANQINMEEQQQQLAMNVPMPFDA